MVDGYKRNQKRKINELLYLAWHVEAFARQKKLPKLDSIIDDERHSKVQTDEEMKAMAMMLNAAFGGEVVELNGDLLQEH